MNSYLFTEELSLKSLDNPIGGECIPLYNFYSNNNRNPTKQVHCSIYIALPIN